MGIFTRKSRDAPIKQKRTSSWLCTTDAYTVLCSGGYKTLAQCPEILICANVYADLISSMTLHLMQNTEKGDKRVVNELYRKLDIEPNHLMTKKNLFFHIVRTMLIEGDGNQVTVPVYSQGLTSKEGTPLLENLKPLPASKVTFVETEAGYEIRHAGGRIYQPDEVLHFRMNPDPDYPWKGTGYRVVLKDVIAGLSQAQATKKALMESPAPSIIVKVDGLTEEFASKEGRQELSSQFLDSSENGKPWFIPSESFAVEQVKPLTLNDLAIAKNMEIDKKTAAAVFGVPPFMVGAGEFNKDEYNNFIRTRVMPIAKCIEQELTRQLLLSPQLYFRFNHRSLIAYDLSEIVSAGSEMVDRMAMRRNEWRDWIGMSPDDEMEELLALENYIPADKLGDQKKLNGGEEENG